MSLPSVTDVPIPVFTPPVRRGWPRTAWCIIGLAVLLIALVPPFLHRKKSESVKTAPDAAQMKSQSVTAKYLVAWYNLSGRSDPHVAQNIAAMDSGRPEQRLDVVVLTGEISGPVAAQQQLERLRSDWADAAQELTPEQRNVSDLLRRMYEDFEESHFDAPSLSLADRQRLQNELGWFGDLALTPAEAPPAERQAVLSPAYNTLGAILGIGAVLLTLLGIGCLGLLVFFVLAVMRILGGGLLRGSLHGGIYAETFALWLVLFVGISVGMSFIPVPKTWQLFLIGLGDLLSLSILAWPVLRGIPWSQVRKDLGLVRGRAGIAEPLIGFWTYVLSLPFVLAGMLITLFLIYVSRSLQGGVSPTEPGHPIQEYMTTGNSWVWLQMLFVASVVAPIVEETMFRGVLYRQMRQVTSRWGFVPSLLLSMLVVSFVFAVIHPQGWVAVPALMAIAFALTLTREWRVSLLPSMVQHGLHNACLVGLSYLLFTS
ncbi:MAG TPA: type II CAAX endopeptidase family protein [Gemmataceae bacterium]